MSSRDRQSSQPSLFDAPAVGAEHRRTPAEAGARVRRDADPDAARFGRRPATPRRRRGARASPSIRGNNVVLEASAGTGKTSVLVARYVNLLKARRRSGQHPRDHLHAEGGGRDARAHRRASCATPRARSEFDRGALDRAARSPRRHRDQHHRRVLPVAAARVSARGGPRSRLRPGRRDRGAAADRGVARSVAADPHRPGANASRTSRSCSRSSACRARAKGWRRCSSAGSSRGARSTGSSRAGPRDLTPERRLPPASIDRCGTRCGAVPGGLARFLEDGPSATRATSCCVREIRAAAGVGRGRRCRGPRRARSRRGAFPDRGRASRARAAPSIPTSAITIRRRTRPSGIAQPSSQLARASRDVVFALQPRSERRARARHQADVRDRAGAVPAGARRAVGARLLRRARSAPLDLLRQMDEFSQSRFRLEARYHHVLVDEFQDTSRAQWELVRCSSSPGAKGSGSPTQPVDLHRRRSQAVDLPLPRRRGRGAGGGGALHRRPAAGGKPAALDRAQLPRGADAARVRQRRSSPRCRQDAGPAGRFTYADERPFPRRRRRPTSAAARRSASRPREDPDDVRGGRRGGDRADPARGHASAIADRRARGRATPGDIGILFRSRASHREFERALEAARHPDLCLQGSGLLRRRRDQGRRRRCSATSPTRRPTCARPRSCARASSACPMPRWRCWRRGLARRAHRCAPIRRGASRRSDDDDRAALEHARRHVPGVARRASIACRPPTCSSSFWPRRAYAYELRGAAPPAGVGEREEDARPHPAHPEPRLRDAARGSPSTSTR